MSGGRETKSQQGGVQQKPSTGTPPGPATHSKCAKLTHHATPGSGKNGKNP
jgi:hypothetical protein